VGLGAHILGARADLPRKLADAAYLAEGAALLVLFAASARSAFQLSVPGVERSVITRILPALAGLAWVLLVVNRGVRETEMAIDVAAWPWGLRCILRMIGLALAPTIAAFVMLRKAAPRRRGSTGLLVLLSASALAILGTQVVCAKDGSAHVLLWHAAPIVLAALLGIAAGRVFLSRAVIRAAASVTSPGAS
jgi:hypothetical protein